MYCLDYPLELSCCLDIQIHWSPKLIFSMRIRQKGCILDRWKIDVSWPLCGELYKCHKGFSVFSGNSSTTRVFLSSFIPSYSSGWRRFWVVDMVHEAHIKCSRTLKCIKYVVVPRIYVHLISESISAGYMSSFACCCIIFPFPTLASLKTVNELSSIQNPCKAPPWISPEGRC